MTCPKIQSAKAVDDHTLVIEFNNKQKKEIRYNSIAEKGDVCSIENQALFKAVQVEQGGYAVVWNSCIDISEYELWSHGQAMP